jgi:thiamine-monophosphate kinase
MVIDEFTLIEKYITRRARCSARDDVALGIGDDCALLAVPPRHLLAVTMDTLVEGVHFFPDTPPYFIGYKALAVSLSDLAAMGAEPAWATLALTLPQIDVDANWFEAFFDGFCVLLQRHNVQLIGGNMARGPFNVTTQLHGFLPKRRHGALLRSGAAPGDLIYVTGNLGDAGLALELMQQRRQRQQQHPALAARVSTSLTQPYQVLEQEQLKELGAKLALERRGDQDDENKSSKSGKSDKSVSYDDISVDLLRRYLYCPTPRIAVGKALLEAGVASAAIDISDGLLADLGHILQCSNSVGAVIDVERLPLSPWLCHNAASLEQARLLALSAGDDYELCFTVPPSRTSFKKLDEIAAACNCAVTQVGVIESQPGLRVKCGAADFPFHHSSGYKHQW